MTLDHTLLWETARVGGMVAYLLAAGSVWLGLLLSLKVRSKSWPRFVTDGLHRHVTLIALIFTAIHTLTVWIDPFTAFTPAEVLVPLATHYRPLWVGLGIVAAYLLVAVWASEWVRPHIGYAWWRRFHYASFLVFLLATLHGIGAGSDTRTWWGVGIYGLGVGVTVALLAWRMWIAVSPEQRAPSLLTLGAATLALALWSLVLPLQPGWNAIANNGNGNGQVAVAGTASAATLQLPFTERFSASLTSRGDAVQGPLSGPQPGQVSIGLDSAALRLQLASGTVCDGSVTASDGSRLLGACTTTDGRRVDVVIVVSQASRSTIEGQLRASASSGNSTLRQPQVNSGSRGEQDGETVAERD